MSYSKRKKGTDKAKWVIAAIAFILVFVALAGVCVQLFAPAGKKVSDWFDKKPAVEEPAPTPNVPAEGDEIMTFTDPDGDYLMVNLTAKAYVLTAAADGEVLDFGDFTERDGYVYVGDQIVRIAEDGSTLMLGVVCYERVYEIVRSENLVPEAARIENQTSASGSFDGQGGHYGCSVGSYSLDYIVSVSTNCTSSVSSESLIVNLVNSSCGAVSISFSGNSDLLEVGKTYCVEIAATVSNGYTLDIYLGGYDSAASYLNAEKTVSDGVFTFTFEATKTGLSFALHDISATSPFNATATITSIAVYELTAIAK